MTTKLKAEEWRKSLGHVGPSRGIQACCEMEARDASQRGFKEERLCGEKTLTSGGKEVVRGGGRGNAVADGNWVIYPGNQIDQGYDGDTKNDLWEQLRVWIR